MISELIRGVSENGVLVVDALIILFLVALFYRKVMKKQSSMIEDSFSFVRNYYFILGSLIVLAATLGSLYYSEVLLFEVCVLCWYQRIFIYSQVVLFGIALWYKDRSMVKYSLGLSIVGMAIAVFHFFTQMSGTSFCGANGGVDCAVREVLAYNYITFPVMGMTIFGLLIILGLIKLEKV
ncbi:disulfide bond formation protein B [Candidatus Pacearchaeota archaeon]|nr:disulfide bond formation protein B [Candidatus Pacearchaeota archaeon]